MSFAESVVQCMQNAGVTISPESVTDPEHFKQSVEYVQSWLAGLDNVTKEALDAATATHEPVSHLLADANVAPGIKPLLHDFDAAVGWPLSTLLQWCAHCAAQASAPDSNSSAAAPGSSPAAPAQ